MEGDVEATESWLVSLSRDIGGVARRSKNGIDLLVDSTESAVNTTKRITKKMVACLRPDRGLSSSEEALFQELGSKVAEYAAGEYLSLQYDVEFWELVKRLHSIRGKVGKRVVAAEEPHQDEDEAEDSPEESEIDSTGPEEDPGE